MHLKVPHAALPYAPRLGGLCLLGLASCGDASTPLIPPTADQDPELPQLSIEVAGERRALHLETFGDSENPVLFVFHGGGGSDYRPMLPLQALADRYFVVMWDSRGSGLSERISSSEISEASYAEEFQQLKQHFSPDAPVTLIGYSFGGFHTSIYLTRHPDALAQLVLIEPTGFDTATRALEAEPDISPSASWVHSYLWQNEAITPDTHERADFKLGSVTQDALGFLSCDAERPSAYPFWRMGAHVSLEVDRVFDNFDYRPAMAAIESEVLIVASGCGPLRAEFQRRHVAPVFRQATVMRLKGASVDHLNLFQQADTELLAALRSFLSAYEGDTP